jgi:hypothetical protein
VTKKLRAAALEGGGLLALATLLLYAWLSPSHIVDGDNAEFATLGTIGGAAHPTGYPAYLLWLRATAWLPGSPAQASAFATAILGAASIWLLYLACRAWGARPLAATIAVVIFAGAPLAIRTGTRAEVFALNDLVVAAVLWLAARAGPLRGGSRAFALGLVAGLGLANHLPCALVAPFGMLGVVRGAREAKPVVLVLAVVGLAIGLLPYVYLFVTPDTPLSWGKVHNVDNLFAMVMRREYGGALAFSPVGEHVSVAGQLLLFVKVTGRTWLWAPAVLGLLTLGHRVVRRSSEGETRIAWALLAASWLLAGPLLTTRFNLEPTTLGRYVVERFHVLPALLLALPVAVGLTSLGPYVSRVRLREQTASVFAATLGLMLVAAPSLPEIARVHSPAVEHYAKNVLRSMPADAVLFAGQEGEYFQLGYVQWALGERQDVIVVSAALLPSSWYAKRLAARGLPTDGRVSALVDDLLRQGRPVFIELTPLNVVALKGHPNHPYGPVVRVLPSGAQAPSLVDVVALNQRLYGAFNLDEPQPGPDDEFATHFHDRYAATWYTLAQRLEATGNRDDAAAALELAKRLAPTRYSSGSSGSL